MSFDYLDIAEAEKQTGRRLDRRRKYFKWEGEIGYDAKFTMPCSGCDGGGCSECGYHGKCRSGVFVPVTGKNKQTDNFVSLDT